MRPADLSVAGGAGMSCNELGVGGSRWHRRDVHDDPGRPREYPWPQVVDRMPVGAAHKPGDPDESGLSRHVRELARQRGGPDDLLPVADLDAAYEMCWSFSR